MNVLVRVDDHSGWEADHRAIDQGSAGHWSGCGRSRANRCSGGCETREQAGLDDRWRWGFAGRDEVSTC